MNSTLKQKYQQFLDRLKKMKDKALAPVGQGTNPNDPTALGKTQGGGTADAQDAEKDLKDY